MTESIDIQMLSHEASTNPVEMEHITNIINREYAVSEDGLWIPGMVRTTVEEIEGFTKDGEIAVARSMGGIVGIARVNRIDDELGGFGMLAVDNAYQGSGIGRELIRYAEQKFYQEHLTKVQLELLVPKEGSHPAKAALEDWYVRLGYLPVHRDGLNVLFPHLVKLLAIPCEFIVFHKELK